MNNFKFRTTVQNVETTKLYASKVELTKDVDSNDMDEAVRVMVVGADDSLYTTNLNTMEGVTANITFSVDPTEF